MRHFSIVADGAFALANENWQIAHFVNGHCNIEIKEFETHWNSYHYATTRFFCREYWRTPYRYFPFLRMEDMVGDNWIFRTMDYAGYLSPPIRIFAAFNVNYVGILDNVEALIGFLEQVPFAQAKECNNTIEALNIVNFQFLRYIQPLNAYISGDTQRYSTLQVNAITPVIFKNWQDNLQLPDGVSVEKFLPSFNPEFEQCLSDGKNESQR